MNKEEIFAVVKKNAHEVLYFLNAEDIHIGTSLAELGANSIDRVDILTQSLADLKLKMPLLELGSAKNLVGLVDLFHQNLHSTVEAG